MQLTVEFDREDDGRIIAEIPEIPGVIVYGDSEETAFCTARVEALRAIADALEHGRPIAGELNPLSITFVLP